MEWLKRMFGPATPRWQMLRTAERDPIIDRHLRQHLLPLGLSPRGPRSWVDSSQPPVMPMFEILLLKGFSMRARWGWSLGFVPHLSAGQVCWHRTAKQARLDIVVEPGPAVLPEPTFLYGADRLDADLSRLLPRAVKLARATWQRGADECGLLEVIRQIREHQSNCFPFECYTQMPLAHAFLAARQGDLVGAAEELERSARRLAWGDEVLATLQSLVREYAARSSHAPGAPASE